MKNRSQSVSTLFKIVAVALISGGTPRDMYKVVMVISGRPTSKGIPPGIDLTASTMADVMRIVLKATVVLKDKKTR